MVWVMQLDILSYELTPYEAAQPPPTLSRGAQLWHQSRADFYLGAMVKLQRSRLRAEVKLHEISRLHQLRQASLAKLGIVQEVI